MKRGWRESGPDGGDAMREESATRRERTREGNGGDARIIEDEFGPRGGVRGGLLMEAAPDVIFLLGVTPSTFRQCEDFSAKYQTSVASCRCQPPCNPPFFHRLPSYRQPFAALDTARRIHRGRRLLLKCKFSRKICFRPRNRMRF